MLRMVGNDIYLPRGDTGKLKITVKSNGSDYQTTSDDRVLFTIKKGGIPVIVRVMTPVDGVVVVEFTNAMTKNLEIGDYRYDIRFIRDATVDSGGIPTDGVGVDTPLREAAFKLLNTVGDV